jgi:EAL domain-containing protein (putative c-di-GMP-specific phosphodiesterase class I)
LTYLTRLPTGSLKIDQSFIRQMLEKKEDLAIVKGIPKNRGGRRN